MSSGQCVAIVIAIELACVAYEAILETMRVNVEIASLAVAVDRILATPVRCKLAGEVDCHDFLLEVSQ